MTRYTIGLAGIDPNITVQRDLDGSLSQQELHERLGFDPATTVEPSSTGAVVVVPEAALPAEGLQAAASQSPQADPTRKTLAAKAETLTSAKPMRPPRPVRPAKPPPPATAVVASENPRQSPAIPDDASPPKAHARPLTTLEGNLPHRAI